jgi:hypothetical protein
MKKFVTILQHRQIWLQLATKRQCLEHWPLSITHFCTRNTVNSYRFCTMNFKFTWCEARLNWLMQETKPLQKKNRLINGTDKLIDNDAATKNSYECRLQNVFLHGFSLFFRMNRDFVFLNIINRRSSKQRYCVVPWRQKPTISHLPTHDLKC